MYSGDEQRGSALLSTRLPRMLRHNNYVGAAHHAPYQQKAGGITMAIADFRLWDRSLSSGEVSALFADPASECCIGAGLKDAYGVHDLDLSLEAMRPDQPSAVAITPLEQHAGSDAGMRQQAASSACNSQHHLMRQQAASSAMATPWPTKTRFCVLTKFEESYNTQ